MSEILTAKDILVTASPLIKVLIETFVKPKLEGLLSRYNTTSENIFIPSEENFNEYLHRTYKKLCVVNTLVFNNSQRLLQDIYIPLTICSTNDKNIRQKMNSYPEKLINEFGNILITDTSGMGKSTLMKKIFLDIIETNSGIPIFIELRRLSKEKKIIQEIQEQLNAINKDFDSILLLELISEGGFTIILDGYDEISLSERDAVTRDIQDFIYKASNNFYFITSRPEKSLSSFGNFQEFKIEPLNKKEAFELLRKYDNQGQVSSLLIKKLQEQDMTDIEEFLTNPLLVSLLFTAFEHKQKIPFKKYLFYRQVYDANFESHDLTKGESYTHDKYSKLEIDDFHKVLRHIGFNCLKLQKIEFSKDEILKLIHESKKFCIGLSFSESDFLQDIINTVPIFTQDGNYYRWAHKSLQEYFAAQFIYLDSKESQILLLEKLYNHNNIEKILNVFDLFYDMDYKTFRNVIERNILSEYIHHCNNSYNENYNVSEEDIITRKELTFLTTPLLFKAIKEKDSPDPFNFSKVSIMFKEFEEKNKLDVNRFSGVILSPKFLKGCYAANYENGKNGLLVLLANKKNKLVKRNSNLIQNKSIELKYKFPKEYEIIEIDDNPEMFYNSPDNFSKINYLISETKNTQVSINNYVAYERLDSIEESLKNESESDFLISGF